MSTSAARAEALADLQPRHGFFVGLDSDGCVFDMPPQTVKRYVAPPRVDSWRRPSPRARRVTGHGY